MQMLNDGVRVHVGYGRGPYALRAIFRKVVRTLPSYRRRSRTIWCSRHGGRVRMFQSCDCVGIWGRLPCKRLRLGPSDMSPVRSDATLDEWKIVNILEKIFNILWEIVNVPSHLKQMKWSKF